jgi:hypothetical protein
MDETTCIQPAPVVKHRKPDYHRREAAMVFRLTPEEAARFRSNAAARGYNLTEWIVYRCCRKPRNRGSKSATLDRSEET